jgi:DNA-binding CsgD family transcriptional regulator
LIQGYQNAEVVTRMQRELDLARQGAEDVERGVIVLAPDGRMQTATARARQWLADYWEHSFTQPDHLPEALQRWIGHHIISLTNNGDAPPARGPLIMEREGRRLVVRLLSDSEQHLLLLEEQRTALPSVSFAPLGLSRRETEVLAWVAQGRSNYAIGTLLGISELTVKKHLEHIYAKLGVWNRTEAAARAVATIAPGRD